MPARKRHEFRQRLLAADDVKPITLEIDIAAHYWQQGAQISWSDSGVIHNKRSPEFTATIGDQQIEVECKAKGVTAGRRVTRPAFYRLVDMLTVPLQDACLTGRVNFTCKERLPTNPKWMLAAIDQLEGRFCVGDQELSLADGTHVGLTLQPSTGEPVDMQAVEQKLTNLRSTFGHAAMVVTKNGDNFVDPILVFAQSEKPDRLLDDILQDLRDKQQQFSGGCPGVICCYLPEVESFEELQADSGLARMMSVFWAKHARPFVHSVSFCSAIRSHRRENVTDTYMPSLTLMNPHTTVHLPRGLTPTPPSEVPFPVA